MPSRITNSRFHRAPLWLVLVMLLAASLACGAFGLSGTKTPASRILPAVTSAAVLTENPLIRDTALTEQALNTVQRELPLPGTETPVHASLDDVQIDYVYADSVVTSLYHLYGNVLDNFVDITITNNGHKTLTFVVQTEVEGYTNRAADTIDVPAGQSQEIHQNPRLLPESVNQLNSEKPGNFHIRIVNLADGNEKLVLDETRQILMYSRRDFVWVKGFEWQEEYELWAAWVTPTDPQVEDLIRAAADYTDSGQMVSGYGDALNDENGSVWDRLQALWQAEQDRYHLTYISTMVAFGPNTIQRMRLPNEVLNQSSGNCVELAILFNAAAEALGLESAIVRIPGHAYTAIRMDQENAQYYFIETTMIGQHSFQEAVNVGAKEWEDASPHFDANEEGYAWVKIADARQKGILPIPWK